MLHPGHLRAHPDGFTLEQYSAATGGGPQDLEAEVSAFQLGQRPSLRAEFTTQIGELSLDYLQVWVEDPEYFHQVLGSYLTEAEEWSRPEVERVLASFRILAPEPAAER